MYITGMHVHVCVVGGDLLREIPRDVAHLLICVRLENGGVAAKLFAFCHRLRSVVSAILAPYIEILKVLSFQLVFF